MYELYNCHYRGTHTHLVVFNQPIFPELIQDKPVPKSKRLGTVVEVLGRIFLLYCQSSVSMHCSTTSNVHHKSQRKCPMTEYTVLQSFNAGSWTSEPNNLFLLKQSPQGHLIRCVVAG